MESRTMKGLILALVIASASWLAPTRMATAQAHQLPDFVELAEKAGPAVVNIRTTERRAERGQQHPGLPFALPPGIDENDPFYEFFRRFFPPRQPAPNEPSPNEPRDRSQGEEVPRGVGSGFIISADGYLLTNHHVVDGADEIYVTLTDKRELRGKVIGSDRRTDVALVKIEARGLPKVSIGDSEKIRVGEWVVAIGSPFGLDNSVTAGIVSAKGRDTGDYLPFIQTDVAVNPGNSGGPLLNMAGEVIGINSQIYSRTGGFMGISFAIPIDEAMRVADELRTQGRVIRGRIGVGIADVTREVAEPLGLPRAAGALVRSVETGGPAERAGVQVGDIILRYGDRQIDRASDLPRMVGSTKPGTKMPIQVWRRGATRSLSLTVDELKPEVTARAGAGDPRAAKPQPAVNALGLAVSDIPAERLAQLKLKNGVLVDTVQGAGGRAGLRTGDIVIAVNNTDVSGAQHFNELVAALDKSRSAVLLVRRGENAQFVPIRPDQR